MMKLDRYDLKILDILSRDGRITKSKLAEAINLSVSPLLGAGKEAGKSRRDPGLQRAHQ